MDWECCWDRNVIAPGDCPLIKEGDEELLVSGSGVSSRNVQSATAFKGSTEV
jgi:hypothetical protein